MSNFIINILFCPYFVQLIILHLPQEVAPYLYTSCSVVSIVCKITEIRGNNFHFPIFHPRLNTRCNEEHNKLHNQITFPLQLLSLQFGSGSLVTWYGVRGHVVCCP